MNNKIEIKGARFKALQRRLRATNTRFKKLTKAQQRVAIAKDVIQQVRSEMYIARSTYFTFARVKDKAISDSRSLAECHTRVLGHAEAANVDLSEVISQTPCEVCGIGSLFASAVRKADNLPLNDFSNALYNESARDAEGEYLSTWFTDDELDEIEAYYECNHAYDQWQDSPLLSCGNSTNRLIMIMENIISNRGRFNPRRGRHGSPTAPLSF